MNPGPGRMGRYSSYSSCCFNITGGLRMIPRPQVLGDRQGELRSSSSARWSPASLGTLSGETKDKLSHRSVSLVF
jgi:hypothetical protein